jgi:hypothetical protein
MKIIINIFLFLVIIFYIILRSLIDYLLVLQHLNNIREVFRLGVSKQIKVSSVKKAYIDIYNELTQGSIQLEYAHKYYYYGIIKQEFRRIKYEHPTIYITRYLFPCIRLVLPYSMNPISKILSLETLFISTYILSVYSRVILIGFTIRILIYTFDI